LGDLERCDEVDRGRQKNESKEAPVPAGVEEVAREEEKEVLAAMTEESVDQNDEREKGPELVAIEEHAIRFFLLVWTVKVVVGLGIPMCGVMRDRDDVREGPAFAMLVRQSLSNPICDLDGRMDCSKFRVLLSEVPKFDNKFHS